MREIIVLSTVDTIDKASMIAHSLVEDRIAACVNVLPGIRSIYRWQEKLCDDMELLLIIKTTEDRFEAARARIRQLHTYELPEVIASPITAGDQDYLRWLSSEVQ